MGLPDDEWRGVGVSSWGGRLQAFEQCERCGEYRARILDEHDVRVVEGQPDYSSSDESDEPIQRSGDVTDVPPDTDGAESEPERAHESDGADQTDDGDDWLIE